MPRIVCRTCGREVYATAPIEQLFADERRCPRCGAPLYNDRRVVDRRLLNRRDGSAESSRPEAAVNPPESPTEGAPEPSESPQEPGERRRRDRRTSRRRSGDGGPNRDSNGWLE